MKNLIILFIFLFLPIMALPKVDRTINPNDKLKVIEISQRGSAVWIDKKMLKVGDKICITSEPKWGKNADYIVLYNLRTNVKHCFCNKAFDSGNSFYDCFLKHNSASSKGASQIEGIEDMKRVMNNRFYLIEGELYITSSLPNNNLCYFQIQTLQNDENITIPLLYNPEEPYVIYISKDYLEDNGVDLNSPVRFSVTYITDKEDIPITNDMYVENVD